MQSPSSALSKAAGSKERARAPCVSQPAMHRAEEQQRLGMERIPWNLLLFKHRQDVHELLGKDQKVEEKKRDLSVQDNIFFLSYVTNTDKSLFRVIKEFFNALAQLSGAKQVLLLRTEMQFIAN